MLRLPRFSHAKYAERPLKRAVVMARKIAARALDLDHVGAHVRKLPRAKRRDDGLLERDDANAVEWKRLRQNDLGIPSTCSPMYDRIMFVEIGAT